jgi:hypothetical protein
MTCLENKTNITLHYKTRWGANDQWESSTISPGSRTSNTWEYASRSVGRSPTLFVKFDDDLSGRAKWRDKALESYRSPQKTDCHRYGKEYHFHYDGSARSARRQVTVIVAGCEAPRERPCARLRIEAVGLSGRALDRAQGSADPRLR